MGFQFLFFLVWEGPAMVKSSGSILRRSRVWPSFLFIRAPFEVRRLSIGPIRDPPTGILVFGMFSLIETLAANATSRSFFRVSPRTFSYTSLNRAPLFLPPPFDSSFSTVTNRNLPKRPARHMVELFRAFPAATGLPDTPRNTTPVILPPAGTLLHGIRFQLGRFRSMQPGSSLRLGTVGRELAYI